ncbi:MAG: AI-2E family transporter [Chloroflexota bacterium]|nr:AI-2E family transporter [Chloroflexota bacterium]
MTTGIQKSPPWGTTIKLVVGLTLVAITGGLLLYFRSVVTSLLLASVLTYLFYPLVKFLSSTTRLSWQISTGIIFILMAILLLGALTATGVVVVQQFQSLLRILQKFIANLPNIATNLTQQLEQYGYLTELIDLNNIANQLIEALQPVLGQAGSLVSSLATGAATSIGKLFFVLMIAYFILADSDKAQNLLDLSEIPDYDYDLRRMGRELRRVWNAFLRGQMILFVLVFIIYALVLSLLGVRYVIGLALLTGLSRFIPYIGIIATLIVIGVAAFFQPINYLGLAPWQYTALVLAVAFVIDKIFDSFVVPRFLGKALGIHPATVLIAAIMAASLLGLVGLILAAPVVATLKLIGEYIFRKMFDLDPWPNAEIEPERVEYPWYRWGRSLWAWVQSLWKKIRSPRK